MPRVRLAVSFAVAVTVRIAPAVRRRELDSSGNARSIAAISPFSVFRVTSAPARASSRTLSAPNPTMPLRAIEPPLQVPYLVPDHSRGVQIDLLGILIL